MPILKTLLLALNLYVHQLVIIRQLYPSPLSISNLSMGLNHPKIKNKTQNLLGHEPSLDQYLLKYQTPHYKLWQGPHQSLLEYPQLLSDPNLLQNLINTYFFRHCHRLLVSSLFISLQNSENTQTISIFYEKIIANLLEIQTLKFCNALSFYYVGFKGFQILHKKFGYFQVQPSMIFVNYNYQVKVWCNRNIDIIIPQSTEAFDQSQQKMVQKINTIITNKLNKSERMRYQNELLLLETASKFTEAVVKVRQLCRSNHLIIPQRVSIDNVQNPENSFQNKNQNSDSPTHDQRNPTSSHKSKSRGIILSKDILKKKPSINKTDVCPSSFYTTFNPYAHRSHHNFKSQPTKPILRKTHPYVRPPLPQRAPIIGKDVTHNNRFTFQTKNQSLSPHMVKRLPTILAFNQKPPVNFVRNLSNETVKKEQCLLGKSARSQSADKVMNNTFSKQSHVIFNFVNPNVVKPLTTVTLTQLSPIQLLRQNMYNLNKKIHNNSSKQNQLTKKYTQEPLDYSQKPQEKVQESLKPAQESLKPAQESLKKVCPQKPSVNLDSYEQILSEWKKLQQKLKTNTLNLKKTNPVNIKTETSNNISYTFKTLCNKEESSQVYTFESIMSNTTVNNKNLSSPINKRQFKSHYYEQYLKNLNRSEKDKNKQKAENRQSYTNMKYSPSMDPEILSDMVLLQSSRNNI